MTSKATLEKYGMKPGMPALPLLAGLFLSLFLSFISIAFISCTTVAEDDTVSIKVQSAWLALDSFEVVWADPQGNAKATLFSGPLQNEASLTNLPGKGYQGEAATFMLRGYEGGVLVFEQRRVFDPTANPSLVVSTLLEPKGEPEPEPVADDTIRIAVEPKRLSLVVGESKSVQAKVTPVGTDPSVTWVVQNPDTVELVANPTTSANATVKALAPGKTVIVVRSVADANKVDSVTVEVFPEDNAPPAILAFEPDTVISIRDSVRFSASFEARIGNLASWSLDLNGDGIVDAQENVTEKTHSLNRKQAYADTGTFTATLSVVDAAGRISRETVVIGVRQDAPRVEAGRDTVIALGNPLAFEGKATQDFGTIIEYRWDFNADGTWDFKSPTTGTTTHTYTAEGGFVTVFEAEDDDGNISRATRRVDIGNKAPVFSGTIRDTVISIKDALTFKGRVTDADGTIAKLEWDFTGTGVFTQATTPGLAQVDFSVDHVFNTPSVIKVVVRATDNGGKTWDDTVKVDVRLDAPIVDAGNDVSVITGSQVTLVGAASDGRGEITVTEWKIGTEPFFPRRQGDTTFLAPTTPQTLWGVFRATDDDGNQVIDSVKISVRASTNNLLQSLRVPSVTLTPAVFNSGIFTYSGSVTHGVASVSITAAPLDPTATLEIDGIATPPSTAQTVSLDTGLNAIPIVVTAQDGSKETYTVTITRAKDANNSLSALTIASVPLTPTPFNAATLTYAGTAASTATSVSVTATVASTTSSLTIGGTAATSGAARTVNLTAATTPISIVVTAQDGSTRTYTVNITKALDANNALSALAVASVPLTPTPFNAATLTYAGTAASTATSVSVTATVASTTSSLTIGGTAATSGAARTVNLTAATTPISIVVTAQDGSTRTYTVNITKAEDTNNNLSALVPSVGSFEQVFSQNTTTYDLVVPDATTSVRLTPTAAAAATSTITVNTVAVNSGTQSAALAVTAGAQTNATVVVTAQSGVSKTYTVRMHRGGWVQAGGAAGPATGFGHALASDNTNVWQIAREGTFAVARRLVGSAWNLDVTFQGVSNPNVMNIASDGTELYASYSNTTNGMQIMAYNGGAWGGHSFASVVTSKMAMGSGRIYMAYVVNTPSVGSVRVQTLNGTTWSQVGETILMPETGVNHVDIVVGSDGNPWLAHNGVSAGAQVVRVRRWNGTTWTYTGGSMDALAGAGFSTFSLALLNGLPHLAYGDGPSASRLSVKQVGATTHLGARGFSPTGLLVDQSHLDGSSGSLVVAASLQNSGGTSYSGYAWRWTGSQWVMFGGGPAASGSTAGLSFTMHSGTPYIGQITAAGSQVFRYVSTAP